MEQDFEKLERQVNLLQQSLESYSSQMGQAVQQVYDISNQMLVQMAGLLSNINNLETRLAYLSLKEKNLKYELFDPRGQMDYRFPKIKSGEEALKRIKENKLSMARFGDGEFALICHEARHKFQKADENLAERLKEVLKSRESRLLVCIADNYGSLEKYTDAAAEGIREYMTKPGVREMHSALLEPDRIYYDAYISRPYVLYKDNATEMPQKRFAQWKQLWENKDVVIVEGVQTRIGVGNDLLAEAATVKRILVPAENAFDRYDDILQTSCKWAQKDTLFLIAMGPAAGVLAYDLTLAGYQALDIGHLDLEYEWFLAGKGQRVPIPYKYNNEIKDGDLVQEIEDLEYKSQIVEELWR